MGRSFRGIKRGSFCWKISENNSLEIEQKRLQPSRNNHDSGWLVFFDLQKYTNLRQGVCPCTADRRNRTLLLTWLETTSLRTSLVRSFVLLSMNHLPPMAQCLQFRVNYLITKMTLNSISTLFIGQTFLLCHSSVKIRFTNKASLFFSSPLLRWHISSLYGGCVVHQSRLWLT